MIDIKADDGGTFGGYLARPRQGIGPGLVLLQEIFGINAYMRDMADTYAQEGYVVVVPDLFWRLEPGVDLGYSDEDMGKAFDLYGRFDVDQAMKDIQSTITHLRGMSEVTGPDGARKVGVVGYCLGGKLAYLALTRTDADVAVGYYGVGIDEHLDEASRITKPLTLHFAEQDHMCPEDARNRILDALAPVPGFRQHFYPGVGHAFATHGRDTYNKPAEMMAYSRTLARLRDELGPEFDLSAIWDKHCEYEFGTREVDRTMATMVAEPYVNHIPTMTGGVGFEELSRFYQYHFVEGNPADTTLTPVSRTIGADRVVDELIFSFTHDTEIDWMLPGIKPTGKKVAVPLVAIICIRGDRLYNEHIYWDQASVLVQIGLLDPKDLPVAGVETTEKLLDPTKPSNTLMANWKSSEGKSIPDRLNKD